MTHSKNLKISYSFLESKDKFGGTVFTLYKKTYSPRHFKNKIHIFYLLTSLEGQQVFERDQLKITWLGNNVKHGGKITWRARPSLPRLPDCLVQLPGQDQDGRACLIAGIAAIAQITWCTSPMVDQSSPSGCSHVTEAATEAGLKPPRETDLTKSRNLFVIQTFESTQDTTTL